MSRAITACFETGKEWHTYTIPSWELPVPLLTEAEPGPASHRELLTDATPAESARRTGRAEQ